MTYQLEITPEAERDIFAIAVNIKLQVTIDAARKVVAEMRKQLNVLAQSPASGRAGGCEGTREIVMKGIPYIAVYEIRDASVRLLRILHGEDEGRLAIKD